MQKQKKIQESSLHLHMNGGFENSLYSPLFPFTLSSTSHTTIEQIIEAVNERLHTLLNAHEAAKGNCKKYTKSGLDI